MKKADEKIAVIGLGYVGLPVAVALAGQHEHVIGFDISARRVEALRRGHDWTGEIEDADLAATTLRFTDDPDELADSTFFIVTVPTPIDDQNRPDLGPVLAACDTLGPRLSPGAAVVFESTVYPGVTDDVCAPRLEAASGLRRGEDFFLGYSPERINPGDKEHRLDTIVKIIAAEDAPTLARLRSVYGSVVAAGLHEAPSIKVAEAAKVIENTQRDLNIALMNELSIILDRLGISTRDVLDAAGTKWNFLRFSPGLVGGHCIGVDPYYLTHASEKAGYDPEVILAGRRINNSMGRHIAAKTLNLVGQTAATPRIGVLGLTFKENVPDLRNSKVPDVIAALMAGGADVLVHDPRADAEEAMEEYGIRLQEASALTDLDALVLAVPHEEFRGWANDLARVVRPQGAVIDVRSFIGRDLVPEGMRYWSL
ncbi:nucleotide sugar dehydrogenase [Erythrobacteraceae bacterium CFH 75059]|uniref:nucleotide sugar dehydrogenase n=1 Tax=Qipengyuania thermophila TaxID=2509361 RepID=UPI001020020A|nr:nucleotide sugar dehydrogenase [Qipengyuania thermophila]TCD04317.1 nucleotide sugar dehydrogenase [Erythrobacteraceae bacterium CFH 75059]